MSRTLTRVGPVLALAPLAACQTPTDDPGGRGGPAEPVLSDGPPPLDIGGGFALNEVTNVPKTDEGGGANVDGGGDP